MRPQFWLGLSHEETDPQHFGLFGVASKHHPKRRSLPDLIGQNKPIFLFTTEKSLSKKYQVQEFGEAPYLPNLLHREPQKWLKP